MSKFQNIKIFIYIHIFFLKKGYTQNWSEEDFIISKNKNTVPWTHMVSDLNDGKIVGSFNEKELQKTSQEKF